MRRVITGHASTLTYTDERTGGNTCVCVLLSKQQMEYEVWLADKQTVQYSDWSDNRHQTLSICLRMYICVPPYFDTPFFEPIWLRVQALEWWAVLWAVISSMKSIRARNGLESYFQLGSRADQRCFIAIEQIKENGEWQPLFLCTQTRMVVMCWFTLVLCQN